MSQVRLVFALLSDAPGEFAVALACALVAVSCMLVINHMPHNRRWLEKLFLGTLSIGAFGGMVGPFCGFYVFPTWSEIVFYMGVAGWSVWFTLPYWRELPTLDRRTERRQAARCS